MKLTIDHTKLADTVAFATSALPARPPVPVLAAVKLTATDGELSVAAYDYELAATATATADVHNHGQALVSGRLLADITRTIRQDVHLTTTDTQAILEAGTANFTLPLLPLEEYPTQPDLPAPTGTVSGRLLADAIAQVTPAVSRDDTLPVLTGIQISLDGTALTLAATDRYRFAVRTIDWKPTDGDHPVHRVLAPAKALQDIAKGMAAADGDVTLALPEGDHTIGLTTGQHRTTLRTLEGKLPDYDALFPTEFTATAIVDTDALTAAIKRVALVADRNTPVSLSFTNGSVTAQAGTTDDAQAIDTTDATHTGDDIDIAFNPTLLLDGLKAVGTDRVQLDFTTPVKPALLHGEGAPDRALRYLLMPVRTS
ncbi:DNA polymerase III subunit beta [Streptomyces sp. RKND-216]|uniref:DNA polymerase III subunit beta n=1 Tax=Streptomyces sp. RKND-216 TaxID=2562581 RepID=UPI00109E3395|nr:DNA polymerase III subunit beta [Streptomyces sp. RKND-216]THA28266.1 DNA polymerase III subunit beta [Streptomyces sp. RKND-216]